MFRGLRSQFRRHNRNFRIGIARARRDKDRNIAVGKDTEVFHRNRGQKPVKIVAETGVLCDRIQITLRIIVIEVNRHRMIEYGLYLTDAAADTRACRSEIAANKKSVLFYRVSHDTL